MTWFLLGLAVGLVVGILAGIAACWEFARV